MNELLAPFLLMNFPEGVVFNCFNTFISKYLPTLFVEDGAVHSYPFTLHTLLSVLQNLDKISLTHAIYSCINQLFRLLVQYHDQQLCSHLDRLHLSDFQFISSWVRHPFTTLPFYHNTQFYFPLLPISSFTI